MFSSSKKIELVAIDDGYDCTKAVSRLDRKCIPTAYSLSPSVTAHVMGAEHAEETLYEIEGMQIAVGPNVASEDTRFEEFPYHPANLALAVDAMRRVVGPGTHVHVIAGLPLNRYYLPTGGINEGVSRRKTKAWSRPIKCLQGHVLPRIAKVTLIAEAVAAWFDFVVDESFKIQDSLIGDFMAVVDIGGRTTDIAVFQNGNLNLALSGTADCGVLQVQNAVTNLLSAQFPGTPFPRSLLSEAAQFGRLDLASGALDVSDAVLAARRSLVARIENFMKGKFGSHMLLMKRILFVGGGAQVLKVQLQEHFPSAVFAADPQMANARGMLKFGVAVAGFEEEKRAVANAW